MTTDEAPHPNVVSRDEWLAERKQLLEHEKELTKHYDRVNAERRRMSMVKIDKDYLFDSPNGQKRLVDLFEGRRQLIVYHFMFDPSWEKGCSGCAYFAGSIGDISGLNKRDTTFAMISRAPLEKLLAYKELQGWNFAWYSSYGSEFNYDFHVTQDEDFAPIEYNYQDKETLNARRGSLESVEGEDHGLSVFFRLGDDVYHTYSAFARGTERLADTYALLDVTPYGRQEDFEDSPPGWPQKPTYG